MNFREFRTFLPALITLLVFGCSHQRNWTDQNVVRTGVAPCPIKISAKQSSFKTAAHVELVFTPPEVDRIYVLEPLTDSFEAFLDTSDNLADRKQEKFRAKSLVGRKFRPHPISWGLPSSVWDKVGVFSQKGVFKVLPGEYRIRILYSLNGHDVARQLCFAETDPFEIREASLWVSTGE